MKTVNPTTGKELSREMTLGDANWGPATRKYMASLKDFHDETINWIVQKGQQYVRDLPGQNHSSVTASNDPEDVNNKCAHIINCFDSD